MEARFTETFASRTRDEWEAVFADRDACVSPVLTMTEAPVHPVNQARGVFVTHDEVIQPAPAPRFSETRSEKHTSELQSLMRISYAVFCLKKNTHSPTS